MRHSKTILEAEFKIHVCVENNVTLNALGKKWKGTARRLRNVLLVALSTGTGSGLIVDGELYTGSREFLSQNEIDIELKEIFEGLED